MKHPIHFFPDLVGPCNGIRNALLVSYLYWMNTHLLRDAEYMSFTTANLEDATGLTGWEQQRAIQDLKYLGFMTVKQDWAPIPQYHLNVKKVKGILQVPERG